MKFSISPRDLDLVRMNSLAGLMWDLVWISKKLPGATGLRVVFWVVRGSEERLRTL